MYDPSRSARRFCQNDERLRPSKPTDPSMTAMKASIPGRDPAREPGKRHAHDEPAVVLAERRDPREQAEVDVERLAALDPGPGPKTTIPNQVTSVERDRERQRARAGGFGVANSSAAKQKSRNAAGQRPRRCG